MENTVLIIGAGFSQPYGYPSGQQLVDQIVRRWINNKNKEYRNLAEDLKNVEPYSIDRFLADNKAHSKTGISAIAIEILEAESKSLNVRPEPELDIIKDLLNGIDESNFKKLKIVSFNYDRLLEWKLFKRLHVLSGKDEQRAIDRKSHFQIHHIHGRMLPLSSVEASNLKVDELRFAPYGLENIDHNARKIYEDSACIYAKNTFNTIFTANDAPDKVAVDAIKWARRVFFLGFGFDEKNMTKLGINVDGVKFDWRSKYVAGTAFRIPSVDINQIVHKYSFLKNRLFDCSARSFFKEHFHLSNAKFDHEFTNLEKRSCCESTLIQEQRLPPQNAFLLISEERKECSGCGKELTLGYRRAGFNEAWEVVLIKS